jgi:tetratricopeptide (TPR) repeat protein
VLPEGEPDVTLSILRTLGVCPPAERLHPTDIDSPSLFQQGMAAFGRAEWQKARQFLASLLQLETDPDRRIRCLLTLAAIHHDRGEFEQEMAVLAGLKRIHQPDVLTQSEILLQEGNALTEMRRFSEAEAKYVASLRLTRSVSPRPLQHISNLLVNWTNARHARMDRSRPELWQGVRRHYERAYRLLLQSSGSERSGGIRADRLVNIAWTYFKEAEVTSDPARVRALFRRCGILARFALWQNRRGPAKQPERREAHILGTLCKALEAQGAMDLAEEQYRRAVALADSEKDRPDIRWDSRVDYASFCLRRQSWNRAYSVAREAHSLAEKERRRRELQEGRIGLSRANAKIYRALIEAEVGRGGLDGARPSVVFHWIEMAKARTSLDMLAGALSAQRRSAVSALPIPYQRFVSHLAPGTWLLEYFELDHGVLCLAASSGGSGLYFVDAPPKELMQEAASLSLEARRIGISEVRLKRLGRHILLPILDRISGDCSSLIVVPHGSLHAVPFHALRMRDGYVVERASVTYGPSASILYRTRARKHIREPFLGVAVDDGSLPQAGSEVQMIALRQSHVLEPLLVDDNATVQEFLRLVPRAGAVHFACHAEYNPVAPIESFLQLVDGPLTLERVLRGPRIRAASMWMNACCTGLEAVDTGEEHLGFVTGFLEAGASAVVATLWQAIDLPAPEFALKYYAALEEGLPAAEALRRAALAFIGSRNFRDPVFWAPYVLSGR